MTLNPTVTAKLLKYGPDLEPRANWLTALFFAILAGDDQVFQLLWESGADATAKTFCEPGTGESVLHMAAASWRDSMLPLLIEYGADVNASGTNPAGQTALHIAAEYGNEGALRELIRAGADVFATYADGKTALHAAAKGGNMNTAEILIDHGIDILARDGHGATPMCVAAIHNRRKMVQFYLDRCGGFMSEESKVDVVIRAVGTGHVGILEMLDSAGFPILGRNGIGDTGLSAASYFGHKDAVVFLLRRGAGPRQQSNRGTTARYLANLAGHGDVAELLQDAERLLAVDANAELFLGWKNADVVDASWEAKFWAGAMSVSETRKVHAPREFSGTFICIHCKYFDFRRGMPPDAEVVHFLSMASLTYSASRGCNGCQFLCDCLAKITDVHGQGIWGNQPATNLTLHPMALGKPLLLSSGRLTSRLSRRVEIYVKERTRTTWPTVGIGRDTVFSNWSEERAAIARKYLRECIVSHKHCPYSTGLLPKRVVRVGSAGKDPHLYISTGELADYVTLSHSWGGVSPITTTTNTISQRMKTIAYKSLPKTFQDAVTITRSLGIQYLWIDSPCIVQDSQEDWQREAANMKHVYANCCAMISADDSPNPHGGCFNSTAGAGPTSYAVDSKGPLFSKLRAYVRLIHLRDPFHMEVCHRIGDFNAPPETSRSLLNLRGWTLQERVLAPRVLHFGRSEFAWECPETRACECQPTPTNFDKESRFKALLTDSALRVAQPGRRNSITHDEVDILLWTHFVSEFTQRQLTYSTDTLHALSGLASYMATAAKADYICGIWKQKLSEFLKWRVDYALGVKTELSSAPFRGPLFNHARPPVYPRRHKSYYAPSWSWASIIGPITFLAGRLDTSDKDQVSHIRKNGTIERGY
ncbi:hypothetical protein J3458_013109 [Metarhizium acridum]|uniref:uncharacterized protein n=1 Tax=Metarhizium acridum TaxID=92637 RepID=UPI001C6AA149|nr:hypothetical protein J3458_013109 [Metarhizium acridum]